MLPEVNNMHVQGYLPDPPDDRDVGFEKVRLTIQDLGLTAPAADEYQIPRFVPVRNQTTLGSCVAWTFTDISEILLGIEMTKGLDATTNPIVPKLSAMFLYWCCRSAMGKINEDTGTYLRLAARQLRNVGICPEETWPYDVEKFREDPGLEARNIASDNRLDSFYAINSTGKDRLNDIDLAINANHPVAFGTTVGSNFRNPSPDDVIDTPSDSIGGHAMSIVGRRRRANGKREYLWLNHWSSEWALNGTVWVTEEYVMSSKTNDLWMGTRAKELVL